MKKASLVFVMLALAACGLAHAQNFDLTSGRVPIASLDGLWRFHTGDNPAWADPKFDDSGWQLLRSDESWARQGYKGYGGMAWYRFQVTLPAGLDRASLYLPHIGTCYEVYADGKLIGTYGKMPPNSGPYEGGAEFQVYPLPAGPHKPQQIEVAIRVWHWPGWAMIFGGGPSYGGALAGDAQEIEHRQDFDSALAFRSQTSTLILGLLEALAGLGTLTLFILRRKEQEYLWFSLTMFFSASSQLISLTNSALILDVHLHDLINQTTIAGAALASIAFYWRLLKPGRTWPLKLAVASVALFMLNSLAANLMGAVESAGFESLILTLSQFVLQLCIVTVVFIRARQGSIDARLLAGPVVLTTSAILWSDGAWTTVLMGWQHRFGWAVPLTQKPFPIDFADAAEALFIMSVFAILILRFSRTRSEEERYAGEVQAARNVQQYLIPEHLPDTPGLAIESEYRPAREVGGDFFQVLPNETDGSVLIVVGDVAGHGMESGMLATLIVGAIRTAAEFTSDSGRILSLLNKRMHGRGLATCLALRIERDGSAALANAGHPPPYMNGREMAIEGALPLGAIAGIDFPVLHFKLAEGDALMLMTDGVAEAQDAEGHLFGFDRITEMLGSGAAAATLAAAAQTFGQEDDITVLTVARMIAVNPA
jgi:phosphoserine phosphatase RsbU/P